MIQSSSITSYFSLKIPFRSFVFFNHPNTTRHSENSIGTLWETAIPARTKSPRKGHPRSYAARSRFSDTSQTPPILSSKKHTPVLFVRKTESYRFRDKRKMTSELETFVLEKDAEKTGRGSHSSNLLLLPKKESVCLF
ncbi:hypothetical protein NPIL_184021 [Nephila pilipes]|uniref:Uncharacterized protein n=1 Tax=Nephila pilipes TaxID=299642 RepID=A0A8X6TCI9_NEPPI|nr:hypothetical protein NPIL_184021 [Nephila pilipes]